MKINAKCKNLLAWGSEPVDINLTELGLTSIRGRNTVSKSKSSNGVGKSTILNSIIYMLYGNYPKGYKKSDMINDSAKKNCLGEIWVERNQQTAYIVRGIKCDETTFNGVEVAGDFTLFFLDGKYLRGVSTKETQKSITNFLAIDYDSFITAALFSAAEDSFAGKTSSKQDEIFSKLLHLEKIETARKKVADRIKEVKEETRDCEYEVSNINSHIQREEVRLTKVAENLVVWENNRQELLTNLKAKETELFASTRKLGIDMENLVEEKEEAEDILIELKEDLAEYDEAKLKANKIEANNKLSEVDTNLGEVKYQIRTLKTEINQAQSMQGKAICSKCFNEVNEDHLYSIIAEKNVNKDKAEAKLEELNNIKIKAVNSLNKAETSLSKVNSKHNQIVSQNSLISRLTSRIDSTGRQELNGADNLKEVILRIKNTENETPPQTEDSKSIKLEIIKLESDIEVQDKLKAKLQLELDDLDFWLKGFGASGIRNLLIRSVIPELNKHANRFAEILTNGEVTIQFTGETEVGSGTRTQSRNKLGIKVLDKTGSNRYYKLSSGEQNRVNLCVNLALNFLVASRIGLPFIIMDEIFLSLDNRGKEMTMELLYDLKSDIPSIFVISNTEDILNESFDNIWTVVRKNKTSRIERS